MMAFATYESLHDLSRRRVRTAWAMMLVVVEIFVRALVAKIGVAVILARRMLRGIVIR